MSENKIKQSVYYSESYARLSVPTVNTRALKKGQRVMVFKFRH